MAVDGNIGCLHPDWILHLVWTNMTSSFEIWDSAIWWRFPVVWYCQPDVIVIKLCGVSRSMFVLQLWCRCQRSRRSACWSRSCLNTVSGSSSSRTLKTCTASSSSWRDSCRLVLETKNISSHIWLQIMTENEITPWFTHPSCIWLSYFRQMQSELY